MQLEYFSNTHFKTILLHRCISYNYSYKNKKSFSRGKYCCWKFDTVVKTIIIITLIGLKKLCINWTYIIIRTLKTVQHFYRTISKLDLITYIPKRFESILNIVSLLDLTSKLVYVYRLRQLSWVEGQPFNLTNIHLKTVLNMKKLLCQLRVNFPTIIFVYNHIEHLFHILIDNILWLFKNCIWVLSCGKLYLK